MTTTASREERAQWLQQYKHIAVVGISPKENRPSNFVSAYMQQQGYTIIPINPRYAGQELFGKPVYASLAQAQAAGEQIEIVDVFRRAAEVPPVAQEATAVGAKVLWVQLGIRSQEAAQIAHEAGLPYVEDKCIKVEHMILLG